MHLHCQGGRRPAREETYHSAAGPPLPAASAAQAPARSTLPALCVVGQIPVQSSLETKELCPRKGRKSRPFPACALGSAFKVLSPTWRDYPSRGVSWSPPLCPTCFSPPPPVPLPALNSRIWAFSRAATQSRFPRQRAERGAAPSGGDHAFVGVAAPRLCPAGRAAASVQPVGPRAASVWFPLRACVGAQASLLVPGHLAFPGYADRRPSGRAPRRSAMCKPRPLEFRKLLSVMVEWDQSSFHKADYYPQWRSFQPFVGHFVMRMSVTKLNCFVFKNGLFMKQN